MLQANIRHPPPPDPRARLIDLASPLTGRRLVFAGLVLATTLLLMGLATHALAADGLDALDVVLLALFLVTLPWTVIGFWNASIGFVIMRFARDPAAVVTPAAARIRGDEAITASVALMACIRNEPPARVIRNLAPMLEGLAAAGVGNSFHLYVLSDTSDPATAAAAAEEASFADLAAQWRGRIAVTYRRRAENRGYKAGNIRDFCERFGAKHEFAVTLDADSFIPASAVLRMVRIMQVSPEIGLLQGLVIGMPSTSAFARIFQFGMRLAMRSYTLGGAWWQGDCGPHWGHNSVLRLAPFMAHCHIPMLPKDGFLGSVLGGHVLSHDQIEAVLMRRAGYEVRVLAEEQLGWEENPPTLLEFIRRDIRWCQGNMQYWHFLMLPGLKFVSRYQLAFAILMFLGSPAWMLLLVLGTFGVAHAARPSDFVSPGSGLAVLILVLVTWFAPKIATVIDVLTRPAARKTFGGSWRFLLCVAAESVFFVMLSPIMWLEHTVFLANLALGGRVGWGGQARDDHAVPLTQALRKLWPQTLLGWGCIVTLALTAPAAIPVALLVAGGLAFAVPLCVLTSDPAIGTALVRFGLGRLPEETVPSPLDALALPALEQLDRKPAPQPAMLDQVRAARGVVRSLRIYYGGRARRGALDAVYQPYVGRGDLVFDIGGHVGDRVASFRRLGARVVVAEPQPVLAKTLRLLYGRDRDVTVEEAAVGRTAGTASLRLNLDNPTVSTASDAFIAAARGAPGWEGQQWTRAIDVPMTTLDALIARHGAPRFIKIDVEGYEAEALAGLSSPVPSLSFEFTTIQPDVAAACIERCAAIGYRSFRASLGESLTFVHDRKLVASEIAAWLADLPVEANSGDVYATLD
jgi:membrane glycosyltransferase